MEKLETVSKQVWVDLILEGDTKPTVYHQGPYELRRRYFEEKPNKDSNGRRPRTNIEFCIIGEPGLPGTEYEVRLFDSEEAADPFKKGQGSREGCYLVFTEHTEQ